MKDRKLPIFFFSFIFAVLVWISVNLGNEFQTTFEIPVRIENLPKGKAVASLLPTSMRLTVRGTGWKILNAILSPNLRYSIDFSRISSRDTLFTFRQISEQVALPRALQVVQTFPETVIVKIDERISKTVPLKPIVEVTYRNGFGLVGKITTKPEMITLYGARALLDNITEWETKEVSAADVFTPTKIEAPLNDSLYLQITKSLSTATIQFDVQSIAEKTIKDIPVELTQVPEKRTIVLIPNTVTIIIRSGVYTIAELSEKNFSAYVDYKTILLDTSGYVSPIITAPENVKIVQQQPEKLQYVIRR